MASCNLTVYFFKTYPFREYSGRNIEKFGNITILEGVGLSGRVRSLPRGSSFGTLEG